MQSDCEEIFTNICRKQNIHNHTLEEKNDKYQIKNIPATSMT